MDRHMADEPLPQTDHVDVIRFLRSGAGLGAHPDLLEAQSAVKLLVREINCQPTGAAAAGLWSALIELFLRQASRTTDAVAKTKGPSTGRTVGNIMTRDPWIARPDQTLSELVNRLFLAHAITFAPVVEHEALLGYVDIHMVRRIDRENWTNTTVDDVIEAVGLENTVSPDLSDDDLLVRISMTGRRKFLVVIENTLVGVVTVSDLITRPRVAVQGLQAPPMRD
jgi:CBS domain-containing protein